MTIKIIHEDGTVTEYDGIQGVGCEQLLIDDTEMLRLGFSVPGHTVTKYPTSVLSDWRRDNDNPCGGQLTKAKRRAK